MRAAAKSSRAIFSAIVFSLVFSTAVFAQRPNYPIDSMTSNNRGGPGSLPAQCLSSLKDTRGRMRETNKRVVAAFSYGITENWNEPSGAEPVCTQLAFTDASDNPCRASSDWIPGVPGTPAFLCANPVDPIPEKLSGFGKAGLKIEQARRAVLDILYSKNACSGWFEAKDATPAATFQSLSFALDQGGPRDIFESRQSQFLAFFRQPYVARATQDGGVYTTITLNAYGAFFRSQGKVQREIEAGGPLQMDGVRSLTVGSYSGDTLPAQMVTLLHEYGHIIDLLPEDVDGMDGKSARNTNEVLNHCRPEVEAHSHAAKRAVKR
jgi:hypothetical protein